VTGGLLQDLAYASSADSIVTIISPKPSPPEVVLTVAKRGDHKAQCVDVTFDASVGAIGYDDGTLLLWDLKLNRLIRQLDGHTDWIEAVQFSKAGDVLWSAGDDKTLRQWDVSTGKELLRIDCPSVVSCIGLTTDKQDVLTGCDNSNIYSWKIRNGARSNTFKGHTKGILHIAVNAKGKSFASTGHETKLWNLETGATLGTVTQLFSTGTCVDFLPHSDLTFSTVSDGAAYVADLSKLNNMVPKNIFLGKPPAVLYTGKVHPNGKVVVTGSKNGLLKINEVANGTELHSLPLHGDVLRNLVISGDGKFIFTASWDGNCKLVKMPDYLHQNEVKITSLKDGASTPIKSYSYSSAVAITSDGATCFAVNNAGLISRTDLKTKRQTEFSATATKNIVQLTAVGNNHLVCTTPTGTNFLIDSKSGKTIGTMTHKTHYPIKEITLTLSPDNRILVSHSANEYYIWDIKTQERLRWLPSQTDDYEITAIAFDNRSKGLAISRISGKVDILSIENVKFRKLGEDETHEEIRINRQVVLDSKLKGVDHLFYLNSDKLILSNKASGEAVQVGFSREGGESSRLPNISPCTTSWRNTNTGRTYSLSKTGILQSNDDHSSPNSSPKGNSNIAIMSAEGEQIYAKTIPSRPSCIIFSDDNKQCVIGDVSGALTVISLLDQSSTQFDIAQAEIIQVRLSSNSRKALITLTDSTCHCVDLETGNKLQVFRCSSGIFQDACFLENDLLMISLANNGQLQLWNIMSGLQLNQHPNYTLQSALSIAKTARIHTLKEGFAFLISNSSSHRHFYEQSGFSNDTIYSHRASRLLGFGYKNSADKSITINSISNGSVAESMGLRIGDRILQFDKSEVSSDSITDLIKGYPFHQEFELLISRNGQYFRNGRVHGPIEFIFNLFW
jgi:WD40 repeat protein